MITKNEETNPARGIESFLKHHLPMVDEVVLVDTGSTDKTVEIAKSFRGVRIFDYKKPADKSFSFSGPRNLSLEQAKYDHILVLDADEKMEPSSAPLKSRLPTIFGRLFGYEFLFVNVPQNESVKPYEISNHSNPRDEYNPYTHRVRYFMNLPCLRFRGRVHEQLWDAHDIYTIPFIQQHLTSGIRVHHYLPDAEALSKKEEYYKFLQQ